MFSKLIEYKMNRINSTYHAGERIEYIDIYNHHYAIMWSENNHHYYTKYKGSEWECYQYLRGYLLERQVQTNTLPIYHSWIARKIRRLPSAIKSNIEFISDLIGISLIMSVVIGLTFIL